VVVAFGRQARQELRKMTGYEKKGPISPPLELAGRERTLVFLAHPNARRSKYPKKLDAHSLAQLCAIVEDELRGRRYRWEADDVDVTRMPGGQESRP
jgi:hypothetical protein